MTCPWHYTTFGDLIYQWQTLLAGMVALAAAILTVFVTLQVEKRKVRQETDVLRKSLAIELRQLIPRALVTHASLKRLAANSTGPITSRMVESLSRVPVPTIFTANVSKVGLLGDSAMDVVIVYGLLDIARDSTNRLITSYRTPDNISPNVVLGAADAFLEACKYARNVLLNFRTGITSHDERDAELVRKIGEAVG